MPSALASVLPYHLYVRGSSSVCVYCVNCTKFGQLILRIIIKIDATRCQILRLKCTKIVFGWGSAPDPAVGAYSAPRPPSWIKGGLLLREGEGIWEGRRRGGKGGEDRGGEGKGRDRGEGKERNGKEGHLQYFIAPPSFSFLDICLLVDTPPRKIAILKRPRVRFRAFATECMIESIAKSK